MYICNNNNYRERSHEFERKLGSWDELKWGERRGGSDIQIGVVYNILKRIV